MFTIDVKYIELKIKLMPTLLTLYKDQSSSTSDSTERLSNFDAKQRYDEYFK